MEVINTKVALNLNIVRVIQQINRFTRDNVFGTLGGSSYMLNLARRRASFTGFSFHIHFMENHNLIHKDHTEKLVLNDVILCR